MPQHTPLQPTLFDWMLLILQKFYINTRKQVLFTIGNKSRWRLLKVNLQAVGDGIDESRHGHDGPVLKSKSEIGAHRYTAN